MVDAEMAETADTEHLVIAGRGSVVRAGTAMDSAKVGTLARGDVVVALRARARTSDGKERVQLTSPLAGWISATTCAPAPVEAGAVAATSARVAKAAEAEAALAANIARKEEAAAALGAAAAETLATLRDRDAHSAVSDADLAVVREAVKAGALTAEEAEALGSRAAAAAAKRAFADRGDGFFFRAYEAFDAFGQRFALYAYEEGGALAFDRGDIEAGAPDDAFDVGEATIIFVHPLAPLLQDEASYAYLENAHALLTAYYGLLRSGYDVALASEAVADHVAVAAFSDAADLGRLRRATPRAFVTVATEAAARRVGVAGLEALAASDVELPAFAPPGFRPRDEARGGAVAHVLCAGCRSRLPDDDDLAPAYAAAGVDLARLDLSHAADWAGAYEGVDLVLCFGGGSSAPLLDAWRAGVPALAADAPAFAALRDSSLDYFEVDDADDVADAVAALRSDASLYAAMRKRCKDRARDYDDAACAARWAHVLGATKLGEAAGAAEEKSG